MTVTFSVKRILLAVALGTAIGPLWIMKDGVSPGDLISGGYWLELLAGAITTFAGLAVGGITLMSTMWNLPTLKKVPTDAANPPGA